MNLDRDLQLEPVARVLEPVLQQVEQLLPDGLLHFRRPAFQKSTLKGYTISGRRVHIADVDIHRGILIEVAPRDAHASGHILDTQLSG